jgi:hypothetical protein
MNCKKSGCSAPAVEGSEYCNEHGWSPDSAPDPNAISTSPNTDHAPQRPITRPAITPQNPETRIATNTEDE